MILCLYCPDAGTGAGQERLVMTDRTKSAGLDWTFGSLVVQRSRRRGWGMQASRHVRDPRAQRWWRGAHSARRWRVLAAVPAWPPAIHWCAPNLVDILDVRARSGCLSEFNFVPCTLLLV